MFLPLKQFGADQLDIEDCLWNSMSDATRTTRKCNPPGVGHAFCLCTTIAVCSALATWRSYTRSDSLTLIDATVCTDEGLLSLQIPLVRLAPREEPTTQWLTYKRGNNMWETEDGGGKATLKNWMSMLDRVRCEGGTVAGFGYWKGAWQSSSRPGPFIVVFIPIWVAIATALALVATMYWFRIRFTLATMLLGTTCVGGLLWLLLLRAPDLAGTEPSDAAKRPNQALSHWNDHRGDQGSLLFGNTALRKP